MSRRKKYNSGNNKNSQLIEKLNFFDQTPLRGIAETLKECLVEGEEAVRLNIIDRDASKRLHNSIHSITDLLPNSFNNRFWFDLYMIESIAETFNHNGQVLTGMLMPRYDEEWAHISRITPVGKKGGNSASINFVCFPAEENIAHIDLLSYPFLLHELGHNLFLYKELIFVQKFNTELQKIIGALKRRAISDQGTAKIRSQKQLQQILELWSARPNQMDWAHEMLMDLVALWTCGPAYLAAFLDEMEDENKNPYLVKSVHPPYAFRVETLIKASEELNWEQYTSGLKKIVAKWKKSHWFNKVDNNYHAMTNDPLRNAIIKTSFETFDELKLPKCQKAMIDEIQKKINKQMALDWGIEIILGAWFYHDKFTVPGKEHLYETWEQTLIEAKLNEIKP